MNKLVRAVHPCFLPGSYELSMMLKAGLLACSMLNTFPLSLLCTKHQQWHVDPARVSIMYSREELTVAGQLRILFSVPAVFPGGDAAGIKITGFPFNHYPLRGDEPLAGQR